MLCTVVYDHQPSSPRVGAAETTLGDGDGARKLFRNCGTAYRDLGVTGVASDAAAWRQGAWIESRTDGCGGVATRTSFVVPLCCTLGVPARLWLKTVLARESGRGGGCERAVPFW